MKTLNQQEIKEVSGAVDWGQFAAGVGTIALGIGIAATPVGWVGAVGAGLASLSGGAIVGDSFHH